MVIKKTQKIQDSWTPPYLGLSPKFYHFFGFLMKVKLTGWSYQSEKFEFREKVLQKLFRHCWGRNKIFTRWKGWAQNLDIIINPSFDVRTEKKLLLIKAIFIREPLHILDWHSSSHKWMEKLPNIRMFKYLAASNMSNIISHFVCRQRTNK